MFRPEWRDFNYYFGAKDVNMDSGKQRGLLKRKDCNCWAPPSPSDFPLAPVWRGPADPVGLSLATGCRLSLRKGNIQQHQPKSGWNPLYPRRKTLQNPWILARPRRDVCSVRNRAGILGGFSLGRSFCRGRNSQPSCKQPLSRMQTLPWLFFFFFF